MKNWLKRMKATWHSYWKNDDFDVSKQHLSQADKRSLWYGAFIICVSTVILCCLVLSISNVHITKQNKQEVEEIRNLIAAYMITATADEYDEIAESIRNDLILNEFDKEMEEVISYIPNSAENCRTCSESMGAQAYLVCTNTGELYALDLFEQGSDPNREDYGNTNINFGYDEISETRVQIMKNPDSKTGSVKILRKRGIVSVHKMKSLFCDDCISKILHSADQQRIGEVVFFHPEEKTFYPVEEGCLQIGNYVMETTSNGKNYDIAIKYVDL